MGKSAIEWTDETWNPVTGCSKVSPGCAHCYAETLALNRLAGKEGYPGLPWTPENAAANVVLRPKRLDQPLRWRKPRMVFVNSMSDLFHELIPDEFIIEVFNVMVQASRHTFQVLTKRPERMQALLSGFAQCEHGWITHNGDNPTSYGGTGILVAEPLGGWPAPNIWLGTSIENRRYVDRADLLRRTPAAVRFISAEPLLGPLIPGGEPVMVGQSVVDGERVARGRTLWSDGANPDRVPSLDLTDIDWLIVGGESGKDHRPIREEWVRDLRDAALATQQTRLVPFDCGSAVEYDERRDPTTGTAFFFKQWGGHTPKAGGRELDGRTFDEFPALTAPAAV